MLPTPHTFFDEFDSKGEWWRPGNDAHKVRGTLSIRCNDRIDLEVCGDVDPPENFATAFQNLGTTIHGELDNSIPITLLKTFWTNRGGDTTYAVNLAMFGRHFATDDDVRFDSLELSFTYLEEWAGQQPFGGEYIKDEAGEIVGVKAEYRYPQIVTVEVPDVGLTIKFTPGFNVHSTPNDATISHYYMVTVSSSAPMTLERAMEIASETKQLLTLLIGAPVFFKRIRGKMGSDDMGCDLFLTQWDQSRAKKGLIVNITYNFKRLGDKLVAVVDKWYASQRDLRPVYETYFSTQMAGRMYVQSRFIHLTQAVESFHRRVVGGTYLPSDQFDAIKKDMTDKIPSKIPGTEVNLPDGLKDKLRSSIRYSNEPSLRKRLDGIFDSLSVDARRMICDNVGEFIAAIVDTRNYMTHLGEPGKYVLPDRKLFAAGRALDALFRVMLLNYLGLPEAITVERLAQTAFRGFSPFSVKANND